MKKYFGFLIVLTLFVLGGTEARAAVSVPGPCVSTATPSINVLSPNGGEVYQVGQKIKVTWSTCNTLASDQVMIILKSTQTLFGAEIITVPNTGTATIILPSSFGGGQVPVINGEYYKIRLELGSNAMGQIAPLSDESNNLFTIKSSSSEEAPYIKVVFPNGGEKIDISNPVTVTFKSNNLAPAKHYINLVDITTDHAYSLDSLFGSYGLTLTQGQINQGEQSITFSAPESIKLNTTHDYLIEICVKNICDKSDGTFKLIKSNLSQVVASVTVLSPNGGEKFVPGKNISVKWKTKNISASEKVVIVLDATSDKTVDGYNILGSEGTLNDGSETFTLPSKLVGKFKVRVVRLNDKSIYDTSDNFFAIVKVGEVTPNDIVVAPSENTNSDSHFFSIPGTGVLKRGIKNASVVAIQNALIKSGYSIKADGSFGAKTEDAVKSLQLKNNLKADGIIGPKTMLLFK